MNHGTHHSPADTGMTDLLLSLLFILLIVTYIAAAALSSRRYKSWPVYRTVLWMGGVLSAALAIVGPIAERAHTDFVAHMAGHLLLGMLGPLLMVLSAPMTLLLRTLPVTIARRVSRVLKSPPLRVLTDPVITTILNVGGLWVLYTTNLYAAMHENIFLYAFIHLHVFLAGYFFTASIIYIDPAPHRLSFVYRSVVLIIALAGHSILSKYIYAYPPAGVPASQAESGGMLMYYGGDAVDLVLIFVLCLHWYKAARPRELAPAS